MAETSLRILVIGAHPDDCEFLAGGVTAMYTRLGHQVKMVSLTNGDAGHSQMSGSQLARRRREEAHAAARALGAESLVLDHNDGTLMPTFDLRLEVIRIIREYQPDLVMSHRTNDYHPDHRYTGVVVQDVLAVVAQGADDVAFHDLGVIDVVENAEARRADLFGDGDAEGHAVELIVLVIDLAVEVLHADVDLALLGAADGFLDAVDAVADAFVVGLTFARAGKTDEVRHAGVGGDVQTAVTAYAQGSLPEVGMEGACRH